MEKKILLIASVVGIAVVAIIAVVVFLPVLLGQAKCIKPEGSIVSKNISLGAFTELEATGPVEIFFTQNETTSVQIEANENIIDLINTNVEGTNLKIFFTENSIGQSQVCADSVNTRILISTPLLESVTASNSAKVFVKKQMFFETLSVNAANSARIEANVSVTVLNSFASNSAIVVLKGFAEDHLAQAVSGGQILASELLTKTSVLDVEAEGIIEATVLEEVEATAITNGAIGFRGRPTVINTSTSSGGTITEILSDNGAGDDDVSAGDNGASDDNEDTSDEDAGDEDTGDDGVGDEDAGDEDDVPVEVVVCGDNLVSGSEECEVDNDCLEGQWCVDCVCITVFNPDLSLTEIGCYLQGGNPVCGESPECIPGVKNVGSVENSEEDCICCVSY